jgi:hypothetical protein
VLTATTEGRDPRAPRMPRHDLAGATLLAGVAQVDLNGGLRRGLLRGERSLGACWLR